MRNISETGFSFVLLGVVEIERFRFLYSAFGLVMYSTTIFLCSVIVCVVWAEESLHEPMYIFIANLVINGIFGSSTFFPKLITDLLFKSRTISINGCILQAFCMHCFGAVEIFTFTLMAHDRYLAIKQPLRYPTLMTYKKALKCIIANWTMAILVVLVPIVMTSHLLFCGVDINNIYCDNMSLVKLACGDTTVNNIIGAIGAFLVTIVCLLVIIYYYIRTFLVCLKISKEACQKAIRTLVTHLAAFSTFMVSTLFILLRYRISNGYISLGTHTLLTMIGLVTSFTVNPLIYGVRTEALKIKVVQKVYKIRDTMFSYDLEK